MIIKIVKMTVNYISGLPKARDNIHLIQSPREFIMGEPLYLPLCQISKYGQGIRGSDNSTENERSIDSTY